MKGFAFVQVACWMLLFQEASVAIQPLHNDFDGDGISDAAVWRPSNGTWYVDTSSGSIPASGIIPPWNAAGSGHSRQWGLPGDIIVPGDYAGDGKVDTAVFRPSNLHWYIAYSNGGYIPVEFGLSGDIPVQASYRMLGLIIDNRTDIAVYRPSNKRWYVRDSFDATEHDYPTPDLVSGASVSPNRSSFNASYYFLSAYQRYTTGGQQKVRVSYLNPSGLTSCGDFNASHNDIELPGAFYEFYGVEAVRWNPSTGVWTVVHFRQSGTPTVTISWGLPGDVPVSGDYDGDGIRDYCVWRPSNGTWYVKTSTGGMPPGGGWGTVPGGYFKQWGLSGDIPVQ